MNRPPLPGRRLLLHDGGVPVKAASRARARDERRLHRGPVRNLAAGERPSLEDGGGELRAGRPPLRPGGYPQPAERLRRRR